MNARAMLQRHRALRWLAPIGVLGVIGVVANGVFSARATPRPLPSTNPARLIAGVQTAHTSGWYGTVVSSMSLGLPELPQLSVVSDEATLTSMLTGSHTLQVWYGGPGKQRVALFGPTAETDLFRNGDSTWEWSSASRRAVHVLVAGGTDSGPASDAPLATTAPSSLTPDVLARQVLAALEPSTRVSIDHRPAQVADRATYELVLTPRTPETLIGSVHISVDGATKLPLGVQVYPRGSGSAALDVSFTSIHFAQPSNRNFTFTPPTGASVRTVRLDRTSGTASVSTGRSSSGRSSSGRLSSGQSSSGRRASAVVDERDVRVVGAGWTQVATAMLPRSALTSLRTGVLAAASVRVSGTWGHGRLYQTALVDALVTSSGRAYVGAVEPAVLYAAAAAK